MLFPALAATSTAQSSASTCAVHEPRGPFGRRIGLTCHAELDRGDLISRALSDQRVVADRSLGEARRRAAQRSRMLRPGAMEAVEKSPRRARGRASRSAPSFTTVPGATTSHVPDRHVAAIDVHRAHLRNRHWASRPGPSRQSLPRVRPGTPRAQYRRRAASNRMPSAARPASRVGPGPRVSPCRGPFSPSTRRRCSSAPSTRCPRRSSGRRGAGQRPARSRQPDRPRGGSARAARGRPLLRPRRRLLPHRAVPGLPCRPRATIPDRAGAAVG